MKIHPLNRVVDVPRAVGEGRVQFLAEELSMVLKTAYHSGGKRTPMTQLVFRNGTKEWVHPDVYAWIRDKVGAFGELDYMATPVENYQQRQNIWRPSAQLQMYMDDAAIPWDSVRRRMP